ncbi:hypothetical protein HPP92_027405 [Vanilla planifolia]|uniref:ABC transporter domain-containing protein n=1 Tax=Vanilla planifolia TaxID=51239 RepID=A0A835U669_VANPL|nr:hypothetical protein HPP92_027405 [Vanilla planifolia]
MELFGLVWKAGRYGTMEINHIREFHLAHAMVALLSEAGALQRYNISQYSVWQIICNRGGARHAAIHETLMNFPEKYSTIVGERGLKLSGGEKQRVSLGRAFLKAPSILLCDEVTSSLDSNTEAEILNALKTLSKNRTSIFIAHRLTVVMQCDEIIVLENDKVVQQGPHEYLLSRAGRYAQLWMQQNSTDTSDTIMGEG